MFSRGVCGCAGLALAVSLLAACGGGGGGSSPPPVQPPANAAPTFGALTFNATEDTDLVARAAATDPEGAAVTITATSMPARGSLVSLSAANGDFVYRPSPDYSGADSFTVKVTDPAGNSSNGVINITIAAVNDAPQVTSLLLDTDEDTAVSGQLLATDIDGQTLTFARLADPANGTLSDLTPNGGFTYLPATGFFGTDTFQLRVADPGGATVDGTVSVTVARTSPVYTGSTTPVTITETNAARSARSAWLSLKIAVVIAEGAVDRPIPAGPVDLTIASDGGGAVNLTGTLAEDGTGTLAGAFAQFQQDGVTLDGRVMFDILDPRTSTSGRVRARPRGLRYRDLHVDGTLTGSLLRTDTTSTTRASHITGDLLLTEAGGTQHRFSNIALDAVEGFTDSYEWAHWSVFDIKSWTGSVNACDSRYGCVDVAPEPAFRFLSRYPIDRSDSWSLVDTAYGNGSLVATGAGAKHVWLTPLSPAAFALEFNRAGTAPDVSVAYRWEDDFAASAGADLERTALAVATPPVERTYARNGTVFRLESRFSEQAQGRFVGHHWTISYAPPGSSVQLTGADTSRAAFTPDRSGDYLFKLQVVDGANTSTDYLLVESVAVDETAPLHRGQIWFDSRDVAGAAANVAPGEEFILDGRRAYLNYRHPLEGFDTPLVWSIRDQSVGQYIVRDAPGPVTRFVAPHVGLYTAVLHVPNFDSVPVAQVLFAAGDARRLLSRVQSQLGWFSLDYDADGDIDSMDTYYVQATGASYLQVRRRNSSGRFDLPQKLPAVDLANGTTIMGKSYFEDLSNDGKPDLIVVNGGIARVSLQQPDGSLAAAVTLANPVCQNGFPATYYVGSVDVDRNGRNDVVRSVCNGMSSALAFNPSNSDGTFGAATIIASTPDQLNSPSTSADIDGDGDREIIMAPVGNTAPQSVMILSVNNSNGFVTTSIPVSQIYAPSNDNTFRIADVNGDGRKDIIVTGSVLFVLTQAANGTFTERAAVPQQSMFGQPNPPPVGDVDGDGRLDVMTFGRVYRQAANGSFAEIPGLLFGGDDLLDVDLDGRADFLSQGLIDFNPAPR